jgi:hypothetical protein
MRPASHRELDDLCRGIRRSFVHLETRDAYGTEVELPHMAKWRRGETDDFAWLGWWLDMLRRHRAAGRLCRRFRVVSEPVSDHQRWTLSHAELLTEAGEDIRYLPRRLLTDVLLPGSGDFYVFDDELVLFLHYAGNGTNASFEISEDRPTVHACEDALATAWDLATPFRDYQPK